MNTAFLDSYIETALWSSIDDGGTPLDDACYCETEFSEAAIETMRAECERFEREAASILNGYEGHVAHDFWLTRNGHGAGFWDGDYPEAMGKRLTELAESYGESHIYLGEDQKFHVC